MATSCVTPSSSSSSSSSSSPSPSTSPYSTSPFTFTLSKPQKQLSFSSIHFSSRNYYNCCFLTLSPSSSSSPQPSTINKSFTVLALVEDQQLAGSDEEDSASWSLGVRPCELYVCNLPRRIDIAQLLDLFKPLGTVESVEVSRNAETGVSRGCGYVTMSSIKEAKAAISALDGSDVDGREMRVKFSVDMSTGRNTEALNSPISKNLIFESPYKLYVGNLSWSVRPEELRSSFTQFGTIVSARVLHDRRGGKRRVYGFLSFSSPAELKAALSLNGSVQFTMAGRYYLEK